MSRFGTFGRGSVDARDAKYSTWPRSPFSLSLSLSDPPRLLEQSRKGSQSRFHFFRRPRSSNQQEGQPTKLYRSLNAPDTSLQRLDLFWHFDHAPVTPFSSAFPQQNSISLQSGKKPHGLKISPKTPACRIRYGRHPNGTGMVEAIVGIGDATIRKRSGWGLVELRMSVRAGLEKT